MRAIGSRLLAVLAVLACATTLQAAGLIDSLSQQDAVAGLKAALTQGARTAIGKLGVDDGFLGNPEVRIPLPGKLQEAKKLMDLVGLGPRADELITTMNRAAEAAVPEAKPLLLDAVKQMSIQDAKSILTGSDDAGTQYFRRVTSDKLRTRMLPIVKRSTDKLKLASQYNSLAEQAGQLGLLDAKDASIESYVTGKTLDGLFLMMANEERAIRKDPMGQASSLLKKVFGAVRQ